MPGSPFQKRKYGEIAVGIRCHIYVEGVTKKVAIPMGIPSPVAVRLRIMAFTVTGRTAIFPAVTDSFFSLLHSGADWSTVTGKSQMPGGNQPFADRAIQELLFVETENKEKRIIRFQVQRSNRGRSLDATLEESQGVLSPFLIPLGVFILGKRSLRERLFLSLCQMREKKS